MASSSPFKSLEDELADALPLASPFTFYHISTPPSVCPPIYSPPPNVGPEKTYCEAHFLNVAIRTEDNARVELLILAVECLIYTTQHLTTIFISKADSTGYLPLLKLGRSHDSPVRTIATTFVSYLVRNRIRPNTKLVVDLFARASDQYLFPGSVENPEKHVSDDRQLVKWWCRVLHPVLTSYAPESKKGLFEQSEKPTETTAQGFLVVPGEETILSFLPEGVRYSPQERSRWQHGHPLRDLAAKPNLPPRCLIPHFPDDPKNRFLTDLDDELPDAGIKPTESPSKRGNGEWKSVRSLEQFWETMAFRSECSSGRLVGFIWIVFTPPGTRAQQEPQDSESVSDSLLDLPSASQYSVASPRQKRHLKRSTSSKTRRELSGPILVRLPRIKSAKSDMSIMISESTSYYWWPSNSRGELVLDDKKYDKATEILLRLDFANQEIAAQSTRTWIDEVGVLGGVEASWGKRVVGKKEARPQNDSSKTLATASGVNVLGVKRKSDGENQATTLNPTLIRKKPKAEQENGVSDPAHCKPASAVNVLEAGLIRKQPKRTEPTVINGT